MIDIEAVSHGFDAGPVLRDVTVAISESRVGIVGGNGSGKSCFARLLNGLLLPDSGRVRVFGRDTREDVAAIRRDVGFVFQNPDVQIVMPTVEEDLRFGLANLGLSRTEQDQRIDDYLQRFAMGDWRHRSAHTLSGGQKQLHALVSVLVMQPRLIVLDEPTTLLDLLHTRHIRALLADLPQALMMISHDFGDLRNFDRVLLFDDGRLVMDGPPADVLSAYEQRVEQALR